MGEGVRGERKGRRKRKREREKERKREREKERKRKREREKERKRDNLKGSGEGISTISSTSNNRGIPCRFPHAKHISKISAGDFLETAVKGISSG